MSKISSTSFYDEFHGHKISHLEALLPKLRESSDSLIWTAGDSSLDNKFWLRDRRHAVGAYRDVLDPPTSVCDVTYWLNFLGQRQYDPKFAAINAAVEATTLNERTFTLKPQDIFIRDNISSNDILVVSIGGNDVALTPTPCTICSMLGLLSLPIVCIENSCSCGSCPVDDYCCGCGPSFLSWGCAFPPCTGNFQHLFGVKTEKYIRKLIQKTNPKMILVCMIYYPDEATTPSWAGTVLGALGYNTRPAKLQVMIRKTSEHATCRIHIPGSEIKPIPLFHVLDGKRSEEFVARVEPSTIGGRRIAEFLFDSIRKPSANIPQVISRSDLMLAPVQAPMISYIQDRK